MNTNFYIESINVIPSINGCINAIKRIVWHVIFEKDGIQSQGAGETYLNDPVAESFIPIDQLTDQQVIDWVVEKNGGANYLAEIRAYHEQDIDIKKLKESLITWEQPLLEPQRWNNTMSINYPVTRI